MRLITTVTVDGRSHWTVMKWSRRVVNERRDSKERGRTHYGHFCSSRKGLIQVWDYMCS